VKCISYNFDGSNTGDEYEDLERLRFENGDIIPNVKSYFFVDKITITIMTAIRN
jgi:hypothetical protein